MKFEENWLRGSEEKSFKGMDVRRTDDGRQVITKNLYHKCDLSVISLAASSNLLQCKTLLWLMISEY